VGETKQVFVPFDDYSFRRWNLKNQRWEVGGEYEIALGENSRDIIFSQKLIIDENNFTLPEGYYFSQSSDEKALTYEEYYNNNLALGDVAGLENGERKGKHIVVGYDTLVEDLKYSKGIVGRIFGVIAKIYSSSKDKLRSSAMSYLPLRSLMQFMKLSSVQAQGFIEACNGYFFKGIKKLIFKK
jgi:beta-glucosidase